MEMDGLNEFIAAQHQQNIRTAETLSRVETLLTENSHRLFGGDGQQGALPYLNKKVESVETRVGAVETWRSGTIKWIGGAFAVLTLEGTALAFYFNNISGHVHAIENGLKIVVPH